MPITKLLERNAREYDDEVALVEINPDVREIRRVTWKEYELIETGSSTEFRREITWSVFDEKANRCANLLMSRGIRRGHKVAILLMNCLEWLPVYFGILKTGALAVPLNYRYSAEEIRYCCDLADVDALLFGPEFIGRVEEVVDQMPKVKLLFYIGDNCPTFAENYHHLAANQSSVAPKVELTDQDDAATRYLRVTGFPKAILHNHESLMHAAIVEQKHHGQTHDDVFLCIPPLYHTGAKMHWLGSLISGSRAVLLKGVRPEDDHPHRGRGEVHDCVASWCRWAQDILDAIDRGEIDLRGCALGQWRLMHIGAQPVPQSLIRRWEAPLPEPPVRHELRPVRVDRPGCVHLGVENIDHVGAIGVPGYGWQVRIVGEDGADVKQGEVGELAVKGPGVMTCYYKDEKATREVLRDGWLFTGDMAMQDPDGFIYLVDRKKDVIITGGENLYPVQIEDFLRGHEAVKDVAVIGLPHPRLGEIAAAIVELKPGAACTERDIEEFCKQLPRYKRPRRIIFAEVPRNPTGKIEKPKLRKMYSAEHLVASQVEG